MLIESIPHIIDFVQYNIGNCKEIDNINYDKDILYFRYNGKQIKIYFNNDNVFTINNEIMKNIDYIKANNVMLKELLTMNNEKQRLIIDDIKSNMLCFERITKYERNN